MGDEFRIHQDQDQVIKTQEEELQFSYTEGSYPGPQEQLTVVSTETEPLESAFSSGFHALLPEPGPACCCCLEETRRLQQSVCFLLTSWGGKDVFF